MKLSLDEMKLLVAKMLPDEITIDDWWPREGKSYYWKEYKPSHPSELDRSGAGITDREWLHVCWLAEQSLTPPQSWCFGNYLRKFCKSERPFSATAEQRIEALCRVKHPELFATQ